MKKREAMGRLLLRIWHDGGIVAHLLLLQIGTRNMYIFPL